MRCQAFGNKWGYRFALIQIAQNILGSLGVYVDAHVWGGGGKGTNLYISKIGHDFIFGISVGSILNDSYEHIC